MDSTLDWARRTAMRLAHGRSASACIQAVVRHALQARGDFPTLARWGMHVTVAGLAVVAIYASRFPGSWHLVEAAAASQAGAAEAAPLGRQASARGSSGSLVRAAQPRTNSSAAPTAAPLQGRAAAAAEPRGTITYAVQPGDTLFRLAERFGVTPDTILSANDELAGNPDLLKLDQQLVILPESGVLHKVEEGETLASIAEDYRIDAGAIIAYAGNKLAEPYTLQAGQSLFLPGARLPESALGSGSSSHASGSFMWPTTGAITQYPWWGHVAIDIGTPAGTPIYASDAGYVEEAGWTNAGYGLYVVIDHGNGYRTLYGHMSAVVAEAGQSVAKGALIGRVGSTGNSTGPHLHFEVYSSGVLQDPLGILP